MTRQHEKRRFLNAGAAPFTNKRCDIRMKSRRLTARAVFFLLSLSLVSQVSAARPKNFEAVYKARYHGISVTATRKLQTMADGTQLFTFYAESWLADLKEASLFRWSENDRIVPIQYHYERSGLGRDREAVLRFDWDSNTVVNNVEQKPWQMDVPEMVLDKLSYQLQIRTDLINGKPLLEYDVADGGRLKQYNFEILGEEEIDTDAGRFMAVKIKRLREQDADRHTIFWLAKDWDYLIVRLQQEDDDSTYEIDLHEAVLDGKEVRGY